MPPPGTTYYFPEFDAPDLGCFVRTKHEFTTDDDYLNIHVEFNPSIDFHPDYHQAYYRVLCGHAAFFQRCLVYRTASLEPPFGLPPQDVLGGDFLPVSSDWNKFPTAYGEWFYWLIGEYRDPATTVWRADFKVGHKYDLYENGTLSTIRFDDTGGDQDFNDLVLEFAIVGRRLIIPEVQTAFYKKFEEKAIPKIRATLKERDKKIK
jgi:hypothetical protein